MESELLAGVIQTETHKRLQVAEILMEYFSKREDSILEFPDFDRLMSGLSTWVGSSNFKVCRAMSWPPNEGCSVHAHLLY